MRLINLIYKKFIFAKYVDVFIVGGLMAAYRWQQQTQDIHAWALPWRN
jgi:hypothetical protein